MAAGRSRWGLWLISGSMVFVVLFMALFGVAVVGMLGGGAMGAQPSAACGTQGGPPVPVTAGAPGLNPEQLGNAQVIAGVALGLGLGRPGVLLGVLTANVETDLRNLPGGDRDSVGLFQQRQPWGSFEERHDPVIATTMFFQGGKGGQPGVFSISGWETMDPGVVMQRVQQSQFAAGTSPQYATKLAMAVAATDALIAGQPAVAVPVAGPTSITIGPLAPATVSACQPAAGPVAAGSIPGLGGAIIAAAQTQLGVRYSWGGGSLTGPTVGIRDGGVADRFGDYAAVGWDCSALVRFAVYTATQGRVTIPRTAADQRSAGVPVPTDFAAMQPGDLIIFGAEHVGIYLGNSQMINAPESGTVVRVDSLTTGINSNKATWTVRRIA